MARKRYPSKVLKEKSGNRRRAELQFQETQGRLLEHAYAKGFYEGALSCGAVFIPGVGLVSGLSDYSFAEFLNRPDRLAHSFIPPKHTPNGSEPPNTDAT